MCKIRKVAGITAAVIVVLVAFRYGVYPYLPWEPDASLNPDPNHTHADFAMWINGEKLDFSDNKYMSGTSTSDESHDEVGEYLHKYFHLHDNVSHVVHQHKPNLVLQEFLESIGFGFTEGCVSFEDDSYCNEGGVKQWRMFVDEVEMPFNPQYEFKDIEHILFVYGSDDEAIAKHHKEMTDDGCLYSQACPWRGPAPEENCIADPTVPCIADLEDDFS